MMTDIEFAWKGNDLHIRLLGTGLPQLDRTGGFIFWVTSEAMSEIRASRTDISEPEFVWVQLPGLNEQLVEFVIVEAGGDARFIVGGTVH
jgi:hypothetical protein